MCLASVQSSSTVNDLVKLNPLRLAEMHRRPCDEIVSAENQKSICRQDGLWHPKQCDQSECWCVNALNGTPDYSTKTTDMISDICGLYLRNYFIFVKRAGRLFKLTVV